jgi:hypothetical protein
MAGSRTQARGFQPIPTVTEKCYSVRLFRRTVPEPSLLIPTISDPSVTKCDKTQHLCPLAPSLDGRPPTFARVLRPATVSHADESLVLLATLRASFFPGKPTLIYVVLNARTVYISREVIGNSSQSAIAASAETVLDRLPFAVSRDEFNGHRSIAVTPSKVGVDPNDRSLAGAAQDVQAKIADNVDCNLYRLQHFARRERPARAAIGDWRVKRRFECRYCIGGFVSGKELRDLKGNAAGEIHRTEALRR